jgi:hypothetical protein
MKVVKQLSIFLENRPGTLAKVADGLSAEGINIQGFSVSDTVDHAVIRLVVDKPLKALHYFGERGILVLDTDIVAIDLENRPGALSELSRKLGEHGINMDYAYGSIPEQGSSGTLFAKISDPAAALKVFGV